MTGDEGESDAFSLALCKAIDTGPRTFGSVLKGQCNKGVICLSAMPAGAREEERRGGEEVKKEGLENAGVLRRPKFLPTCHIAPGFQ